VREVAVRRLAIVLLALTAACGAELGGGAGVVASKTGAGDAMGFGRVAASTKLGTPINDHGVLVGTTLENRMEQNTGSRWTAGIILGYGAGPSAIEGTFGWEAYAELGTPIRETIFRRLDHYSGIAFAVPIRLGSPRRVTDLNTSTWVLTRRFEIVPLVRARFNVDHPDNEDAVLRVDLAAGVTFRLRIFTDLF
jgi:hypothetical protein